MSVHSPTSLSGALDALAERPDAHVLAGGTDFMVEVNFGHRRPESVISIGRVAELRQWSFDAARTAIRIGSGVTYTELMRSDIATLVPALAEAARTVGSPQIRNAGTIGGNLATCSPAGDTLPVLAALNANIELASVSGVRSLPFAEFMVGPKRSARTPSELVTAVTIPVTTGWQGFAKVGTRNAMVIAVCNAALVVDNAARSVHVAMGSVGPVIIRPTDAERWIADQVDWEAKRLSGDGEAIVAEFARRCSAGARPIDDHRSTADYRRHAVGVLSGRLLKRAFA